MGQVSSARGGGREGAGDPTHEHLDSSHVHATETHNCMEVTVETTNLSLLVPSELEVLTSLQCLVLLSLTILHCTFHP